VNGGVLRPPTLLLFRSQPGPVGLRMVSQRTSADMRALLRNAVLHGTGAQADVPGYAVGGKTGTSATLMEGRYDDTRRLAWFFCTFPLEEPAPAAAVPSRSMTGAHGLSVGTGNPQSRQKGIPRYTVFLMLDSPQVSDPASGPATAQWSAVPTAGRIVRRIGPLMEEGGAANPATATVTTNLKERAP